MKKGFKSLDQSLENTGETQAMLLKGGKFCQKKTNIDPEK